MGVLTGLLPLAVLAVLYPGFSHALLEKFSNVLYSTATGVVDVAKGEIPWPWTLRWEQAAASAPNFLLQLTNFLVLLAQGCVFLTVPLLYLFLVPPVLKMKKEEIIRNPLLTGSFFVGIFYLHQVLSRADITHVGEGIFPAIAVIAALPASKLFSKKKGLARALAGWMLALTLLAVVPISNLAFGIFADRDVLVPYPVGKDRVWIFKKDASWMDAVRQAVVQNVPSTEPVLLAPVITTMYCLLEKESPVYETYLVVPPSLSVERGEVRAMEEKKVRWAIVSGGRVCGREELSLPATRPLLWGYLTEHFETVPAPGLPPGYSLLRRKA